jgi:hypothetical protein
MTNHTAESIGGSVHRIAMQAILRKSKRVAGIAIALIFAVSTAAAGNPTEVNIVNTPTVNVGNTPTVNIGAGSVAISNTPTVTLSNTTTNPVPALDVERAARLPYQSFYDMNVCSGIVPCGFTFASVPSGYRLVVQHISGAIYLTSGTTAAPTLSLANKGDNKGSWEFAGKLGSTYAGAVYAAINEDVQAYFDPTDPQPQAILLGNLASGFDQTVTLSGYLENCAITGCPAIYH